MHAFRNFRADRADRARTEKATTLFERNRLQTTYSFSKDSSTRSSKGIDTDYAGSHLGGTTRRPAGTRGARVKPLLAAINRYRDNAHG